MEGKIQNSWKQGKMGGGMKEKIGRIGKKIIKRLEGKELKERIGERGENWNENKKKQKTRERKQGQVVRKGGREGEME